MALCGLARRLTAHIFTGSERENAAKTETEESTGWSWIPKIRAPAPLLWAGYRRKNRVRERHTVREKAAEA